MKVRPGIILSRPAAHPADTEILLLRYQYGAESVYAIPGGNTDKGETLPQTIVRELQEEIGVAVKVGTMVLCGEVILDTAKNDVLHAVFQGEITQGDPALNPAETTALEIVWKSINELEDLTLYPNIGRAIHKWFTDDTPEPGYVGRIQQPYF